MVNNFEQIKGLLSWRTEDDFYYIQILQRKKDHKDNMRVGAANNNARLVKSYMVKSLEHLEFLEPEIIELCNLFNARAGINLNRRSFEKTHLKLLKKVVEQMENKSFDKGHKAYDSVVGANAHETQKKWILDIDYPEFEEKNILHLMNFIDSLQPIGLKAFAKIPSKNGIHLITSPFNLRDFKEKYPTIDVQKNNPTNLFIP